MKRDSRLSVALHVLLHMEQLDAVVTSETLGPMMQMNPVVLRRTIGRLREAGIVRSEKGHGGGWSLARPLAKVTLADVYEALGLSEPFSIGTRIEQPRCLLERAANRALTGALDEAEAVLKARLASISVADLAAELPVRPSQGAKKGARHA
jgi:Rrf2 family protein